jgi:hypothetical protein
MRCFARAKALPTPRTGMIQLRRASGKFGIYPVCLSSYKDFGIQIHEYFLRSARKDVELFAEKFGES